jgi:hypothetical protein
LELGGYVLKQFLTEKDENMVNGKPKSMLLLKRNERGDCSECMETTDYLGLYNNKVRHMDLGEPEHGYGDGIHHNLTLGSYSIMKDKIEINLDTKKIVFYLDKNQKFEFSIEKHYSIPLDPGIDIPEEKTSYDPENPNMKINFYYSDSIGAFLPGDAYKKILSMPKKFKHIPKEKAFMGLEYDKSEPYIGYFYEVKFDPSLLNFDRKYSVPKLIEGEDTEEFLNW